MAPRNTGESQPYDFRRTSALLASLTLLGIAWPIWQFWNDSTGIFVAAMCVRIGLIMGSIWLAWPSLKRPSKWLPASAPVIGVVAIIAIAARPTFIFPAIMIVGLLIAVSALASAFRKR